MIRSISKPICHAKNSRSFTSILFDLFFIVDSIDSKNRSMSICEVFKKSPEIVVVHDLKNYSYQKSLFKYVKYYRFNALFINTNVYIINKYHSFLKNLDLIFEGNKNIVIESDTRPWKECFNSEGLNNV